MNPWLFVVVLVGAISACATSFQGSAHFPGGAGACAQRCSADGLEMGGFIYMGEYSSGCVCEPPGSTTSPAPSASVAAAAGVMDQMRRQERQANATIIAR